MPSSAQLASHLPGLRRYARALTGSQKSGDAFVAAMLHALLEDRTALDTSPDPRVSLYKTFHAIWASGSIDAVPDENGLAASAQERLQALTPLRRQALLLATIEGFSREEVARIIGVSRADADQLINEARADMETQAPARVLIIEDEMLIAVDLADIVQRLGHDVIDTVDTARKALNAARAERPSLILADIQLADGSSGIDAVRGILEQFSTPVIFITAFPDRLLTGERPEPTFLISKPYAETTVQAAISQALFFQSTAS